jgi:formate hydrogenlyase subunit 3/multisubunit Na+/H+ antiporter MnhD subunit
MKDLILNTLMWPVEIPVAAGLIVLALPRRAGAWLAALAGLGTLLAAGFLWTQGPLDFSYGSWLNLRLDNLSRMVVVAIALFGFLIALYSLEFMKGKAREKEYYCYLLLTLCISIGAVLASDLILMLVLWGLLGVTLYLMVGLSGPGASAAAKKSFIIVGGSDSLLVLGIIIIWFLTKSTHMGGQLIYFDRTLSYVAFLGMLVAALAKAGAMPFHSWIPDVGEKALIPVSAFLPASLDKLLGIYLLSRLVTSIFVLNLATSTVIMLIGAVTVVCAVMMALVQHDLKRLLSYHAVSQVGYMVLGIGTGLPVGIAGGLFHMLNHAMYKSTLFLGAGAVEQKAGTTDLDKLGGLAKAMPVTFIATLLASLAISGIPPMNGFASKWMIYQGIIETGENGGFLWVIWLVSAMLGSALTLASFAKVLHAVFLRKQSPALAARNPKEVGICMWLPMIVLAGFCLVFGVAANALPLPYLIFPAVPGAEITTGTWWSGPATLLLAVAFLAGGLLYWITTVRKARVCPTYIGGETMDKAYISGQPQGVDRDLEVTGADFYLTIENLKLVQPWYRWAQKKIFDIYDLGTAVTFYMVNLLRRAHSGVLPSYLTWVLAGLLAVLAFFLFQLR